MSESMQLTGATVTIAVPVPLEQTIPTNNVDQETLDNVFKYHAPDGVQVLRYGALRESAKDFARVILAHCPASADRSAALRHVREALMTANAAIALDGKSFR